MMLSLVGMQLRLLVVVVMVMVVSVLGNSGDHGGVPMGVVNVCDDAKTHIEVDWDPQSTAEYTCDGSTLRPNVPKIESGCEKEPKKGIHVCYPNAIDYTDIPPTSGRHRPNWPVYGEYTYVPPQRWLHSLEHGAVVMLYHPCADPEQVAKLRNIVVHCLRKHVITPYKLLPQETPFALLTWGCKVLMSSVTTSVATSFIKNHAKHAPEGRVASDGKYNTSLIVPTQIVSDFDDTVICPEHPKNAETSAPVKPVPDAAHKTSSLSGQRGDSKPLPQRRENPILVQSRKRRQRLNEETEKLDHNVKRLIQTYRKLVSLK